jgi:diguanylate cyclase (GGDEF)-like protein
MNPPERFDVIGVVKFILLQTVAVLALVMPTTFLVSKFFYHYLMVAQAHDPNTIFWFITILACAETVAFCPIMVVPISVMMRRVQDAQAQLERLADTDALTGLLNRRGLEKAAGRLIAAAAVRGDTVAALVFDIDHFKRVNDLYGHDIGDETLRTLGALLGERFAGEAALAGRLGGEEFLALVAVRNPRAAEAAAEATRRAFAAYVIAPEGAAVRCTLSVGVAAAAAPREPAELISRADAALYAAKTGGRDRVAIAEAAARAA